MSVVSNKIKLFLLKTFSKYLMSGESQTSCARLFKVRIVVTLY